MFLAFLFPQENQTDDKFINLRLIYSVMHFILEMDACFLKGQEHYHSFRLFVWLLYFLTSCLPLFFPLVLSVVISEEADVGNKSGRLS